MKTASKADWLRSEIEKLEEITPTPPNVLILGEGPIEHALREGEYHALTSIITRHKEELLELENHP